MGIYPSAPKRTYIFNTLLYDIVFHIGIRCSGIRSRTVMLSFFLDVSHTCWLRCAYRSPRVVMRRLAISRMNSDQSRAVMIASERA